MISFAELNFSRIQQRDTEWLRTLGGIGLLLTAGTSLWTRGLQVSSQVQLLITVLYACKSSRMFLARPGAFRGIPRPSKAPSFCVLSAYTSHEGFDHCHGSN